MVAIRRVLFRLNQIGAHLEGRGRCGLANQTASRLRGITDNAGLAMVSGFGEDFSIASFFALSSATCLKIFIATELLVCMDERPR